MNEITTVFETHRARLYAIALRMLGARCEADDVMQDAYLRWHHAASREIRSPAAFLVTITTRLCLDRLRRMKEERDQYVDPMSCEHLLEDPARTPETQREHEDNISIAFVTVLERLGIDERMAFLLHDVFDYGYPEIAEIVGKTEAACRQMVHRARPRVRDAKPRYAVTAASRQRLLQKFVAAAGADDREAVMKLLSEGSTPTDGGAKVVALRKAPQDQRSDAAVARSSSGCDGLRQPPDMEAQNPDAVGFR